MEKYKAKRILESAAAVSASVAIAGSIYATAGLYNLGNSEADYDKIIDRTTRTEEYCYNVKQHKETLLQQLTNGEISKSDYDTRLKALEASEYVEQFVGGEDLVRLERSKKEIKSANDVTTVGMSAAALGVFAYVGSKFANTNYDAISRRIRNLKKKEEQDLDNVL